MLINNSDHFQIHISHVSGVKIGSMLAKGSLNCVNGELYWYMNMSAFKP